VTNYIALDGPLDYIFHFASPASPIDYLRIPIQTLKVGALGTHNALGLAKAKGARLLLASTSEVYGDPLVHPQREDYWGNVNPIGPRGVYDEAVSPRPSPWPTTATTLRRASSILNPWPAQRVEDAARSPPS
jgi:dTDP-glucose 4,6-dehydratase